MTRSLWRNKSAQSCTPAHWHGLSKALSWLMHCMIRRGLSSRRTHTLLLKALRSHCSCLDFGADLWLSGKQTAGLLDKQRDRSCFWIRLTWIIRWSRTNQKTYVSDTDLQVKCTNSLTTELMTYLLSGPPVHWTVQPIESLWQSNQPKHCIVRQESCCIKLQRRPLYRLLQISMTNKINIYDITI